MDCQELNNQIYDYCDDSVSPQAYLKISKHLKECDSCQHVYQWTRLENEVLRDTSDIPDLPADFTPRIMAAIGQLNPGVAPIRSRKLWYSGLLAAAAVIALCLYASQFFNSPKYANVADNSGIQGDAAVAPYAVALKDAGTAENQVAYNDSAPVTLLDANPSPLATDNTITPTVSDSSTSPEVLGLRATPSVVSTTPAEEPDRVSILTDNGPVVTGKTLAAPNPTDVNGTALESVEPVQAPVNVPSNLQLRQVDISASTKTIYEYSSSDDQTRIQITVEPFIEPTAENQALNDARDSGLNALARWILIGDQMKTVTYSGNISMDELNDLANTVQFQ